MTIRLRFLECNKEKLNDKLCFNGNPEKQKYPGQIKGVVGIL